MCICGFCRDVVVVVVIVVVFTYFFLTVLRFFFFWCDPILCGCNVYSPFDARGEHVLLSYRRCWCCHCLLARDSSDGLSLSHFANKNKLLASLFCWLPVPPRYLFPLWQCLPSATGAFVALSSLCKFRPGIVLKTAWYKVNDQYIVTECWVSTVGHPPQKTSQCPPVA